MKSSEKQIVKAKSDKYDEFSKVFVELSGESQDKLVKIAHRLLETHQFARNEGARQRKPGQKEDSCIKN